MKKLLTALAAIGLVSSSLLTVPRALATLTYSQTVLADSPLGYYRMSETSGTTAFDETVPQENGTYLGGVTLGSVGPRPPTFTGFEANNTATFYDGVNDQLENNNLTTLNNTAYSFEVWLNYTATGGVQYFGGRGAGSLTYDSIGVNNQSLLFFNGSVSAPAAGNVSQGAWHHLVYTRNNTAVNVYLDSVLKISTTSAITYGTSDRIVAGNRPGDDAWLINGMLDELAIYDRVLSAEEVANHYLSAFNVPEPSTMMLMGIGGLLLRRQIRSRRA